MCKLFSTQTIASYINVNPKVQFGKPPFRETRVPVQRLFRHLEKSISIDTFPEDFPGVFKEQVETVIERNGKHFEIPAIIVDETIIG